MSSDGNSDTTSTNSPSGSSEASHSPGLDSQSNFGFDKDGTFPSTDDFELHLTDQVHAQIRKATHKLSEKKRRKAINKRYDELKKLLPGLSNGNGKTVHSKQTILKHAERKMWEDKIQKLRDKRGFVGMRPTQTVTSTATIIQPIVHGQLIPTHAAIQLPVSQVQIINGHLPTMDINKNIHIHSTAGT
ncbi:uncharacterized protein LOC144355859 [Saccoglossus kowalevskii]